MTDGLLLDSCTFLWLVSDQSRLPDTVKQAIRARPASLTISAISAFEIGVKHARGKLRLPLEPATWMAKAMEQHGIHEIAVDCSIAAHSTQLPPLHNDPCDRIIVATAQLRNLTIMTPDALIRAYPGIVVVW